MRELLAVAFSRSTPASHFEQFELPMCFTKCYRGEKFPAGTETGTLFIWLTKSQHTEALRTGIYTFKGFEKVNFSNEPYDSLEWAYYRNKFQESSPISMRSPSTWRSCERSTRRMSLDATRERVRTLSGSRRSTR